MVSFFTLLDEQSCANVVQPGQEAQVRQEGLVGMMRMIKMMTELVRAMEMLARAMEILARGMEMLARGMEMLDRAGMVRILHLVHSNPS